MVALDTYLMQINTCELFEYTSSTVVHTHGLYSPIYMQCIDTRWQCQSWTHMVGHESSEKKIYSVLFLDGVVMKCNNGSQKKEENKTVAQRLMPRSSPGSNPRPYASKISSSTTMSLGHETLIILIQVVSIHVVLFLVTRRQTIQ